VHRKEVFDAIQRENRKAAGVTSEDLAAAAPPQRDGQPHGK
jgi:sRNA-binding carbon storage regulator CsrA